MCFHFNFHGGGSLLHQEAVTLKFLRSFPSSLYSLYFSSIHSVHTEAMTFGKNLSSVFSLIIYMFFKNTLFRGGQANFFLKYANRKSPNSWAHSAIANWQISLVCQSANRKSAKFFIINPQIVHCTIIAQLCLKTVLKVVFLLDFYYVQILIWALYAIFVWRKSMYLCGLAELINRKFSKGHIIEI